MWRVFFCPHDLTKPYTKPALSYEDQARLLESRGLIVTNHAVFVSRLRAVGYYRLCGYWHPYRDIASSTSAFLPNTPFDDVWERYRFDRQLRLMVMDAIERVEVAVRTALVHELAMRAGPFAHLDGNNFRSAANKPDRKGKVKHANFVADLREKSENSSERFVEHFKDTYDGFPDLPIWAVCETMTFGGVFTLFNMSEARTQKDIARQFALSAPVMVSWLHTLNYVRNICAHHARLWNRDLAVQPELPEARNDPRWYGARAIGKKRVFVVLTLLNYLLKEAAPHTKWRERLVALFGKYQNVPLKMMGIPADWRTHDLWK